MTVRTDSQLLERAEELAVLRDELDDVSTTRRGRLVLIEGEAGIGKSTLVQAFCESLDGAKVLSGACDALHTPRPLGPFVDIADQTGGDMAGLVNAAAGVGELLGALMNEIRQRTPTIVVLEDLHWADQATLDLIRLLGRRIETVPALVLATFRSDELDRAHPLRVAIGDLPRNSRRRLPLEPLSRAAVADLAEPLGLNPDELHARTAGNPFYVTEALAAGGAALPDGVRDAVLARAARLEDGARGLLDAVAIAPRGAELWLLEAIAPDELGHLERSLASGMLRPERHGVAFRHEIARVVLEEALPPDRAIALHRRALHALTNVPWGREDLARITHHAEAAGDAQFVLRYAPAAAERAAALGAHRESADLFARALRFADRLDSDQFVELLERRSYECYLTNAIDEAIEARTQALEVHHERGDVRREGDDHRWLSRLLWFKADNASAYEEAGRAVELLEQLPPGRELAMAYSNMAQLLMLSYRVEGASSWGARAGELAERLGETEILIHALNNVGTAELGTSFSEGIEKLERSLALALDARLEEHVARAYANLATGALALRKYELGDRYLEAGIGYCRERDLDSWTLYMMGWEARSLLEQGDWDRAAECATSVLGVPALADAIRITPLIVLGRLRARRGDPDPWGPLDEALELAKRTGEVQRLGPVAAARAEARWLAGETELVRKETDAALALLLRLEKGWDAGELCAWRRRAGIAEQVPDAIAEPFRLELVGESAAASARWYALGCLYEAAIAAVTGGEEAESRRALEELQRLGARATASRVARALRERGIRDLRHGPRTATLENAAGLTARELEVLELVADGMRNGQIAERLVVSRKTIDHHVSAILRKLDAGTRTEAVAEASRVGILGRGKLGNPPDVAAAPRA